MKQGRDAQQKQAVQNARNALTVKKERGSETKVYHHTENQPIKARRLTEKKLTGKIVKQQSNPGYDLAAGEQVSPF